MAEFLVHAKDADHTYDACLQLGDIIIARPDGWGWGNYECLPDFLVVKVPGLDCDPMYEIPLYTKTYTPGADRIIETVVVDKRRRYQLIPDAVQGTIDELYAEKETSKADVVQSVIELDIDVFQDALLVKINEFDQAEFTAAKVS